MAETTSYTRPTLSGLRAIARAYFKAQGFDSPLSKAVIWVIADVLAYLVYGIYGFLDFLIRQIFPDTAVGTYLARWAAIFSISRKAASYAAGSIVFSGTAGTAVPSGTAAEYAATGISYATAAAAIIGSGGTVTVAATAQTAGADGNISAGASLTLATAISGVSAAAAVADGGMTGGEDQESESSWRARVVARIQSPPQGGTASDYVTWAEACAGVTRAWCYPKNRGRGTVDLAFVMDGRADIIPTATDVSSVQDYIDGKRPITDDCVVFAPVGTPLNLVLASLTPNTATVQAAVSAAWSDMIKTFAEPGGSLSFQDQMCAAIKNAAGVTGFSISSPAANQTAAAGHIFTPGTVTFPA
jgi:uncharacterized phage protein gp47/JayE